MSGPIPSRAPGSRFLRVDFHTHTPASGDYQDRKATAADVLAAAEEAAIDILAVTDHNSATWVDPLRTASKGRPVTVLPGVEITTPEGHILGLFDLDCPSSVISDLLVRVGIPRDQHGREEAISTQHAEEVIRAINAGGGLAIAAHANEANGLLKAKGQYKLAIVPMPELGALELTKQGEIERFCAGKVSADYKPKACTHSSDSHALKEIGRRVTYLKMDRVSLRGIRQALLDYEVKVRFPWDYKEPTHPAILSLSVDQGFFGGQRFAFHDGLNCLVGGKGTGKSTVIELLRYCFGDVSGFDAIREDHQGKVVALIGIGGAVTVEFRDSDGDVKSIRREVQEWDVGREVRDAAGNLAALETPPVFFSQGELVQIASTPIAQLELLDRHLDLSKEDQEERRVVDALGINATGLVGCRERLVTLRSEIDHPESGKAATEAQYAKLERQLKNPVLTELPAWEAEQAYLQSLTEALRDLPGLLTEVIQAIDLESLRTPPPERAPNKKRLSALGDTAERVEGILTTLDKQFREKLAELQGTVKTVAAELSPLFAAKNAEHKRVLDALGQADVRKATAQHRNLGKRLETLRHHEVELGKVAKMEATFAKERKELRARLEACRQERWKKRAAKAAEYETQLAGLVRVAVTAAGDRRAFSKALRDLSRKGYVKDPDIRHIASGLDPSTLVHHIQDQAFERIAEGAGVTKEVAKRLVESCSGKEPQDLYELEAVPLPDQPDVRYVVGPGREKPLRELSTGQKGTVIIALAMAEGAGPLVIDQPEEPLDTQSIYGQVVRTIRHTKENRQFVFTTHNPNIAVGADADLSHILDADADKGTIVSSGGIDRVETNRLLLVHLEGGKEALELRVKKYAE
jgi:AAA domain-containing protein